MILLTLSVTYAQSVTLIRKENGEVKFKYKSTDKNNSQSIDTTFNASNDEEFYNTMQGISDKYDLNLSMLKDRSELDKEFDNGISYSMHIKSDDRKKLKNAGKKAEEKVADIHIEIDKSMRDLEEVMKELEASMANMKFEMNFDDDEDDLNINIHGNPPHPPSPLSPPRLEKKHVEISIDNNGKKSRVIKKYDRDDLAIPDSLDNDEHMIMFGEKDEEAPELEKIITNENGRQIFIYKRKKK